MGAPIKRTTYRLSGADLRRFLARVFQVEGDLSPAEAERLAIQMSSLLTSVRVHRSASGALRKRRRRKPKTEPMNAVVAAAEEGSKKAKSSTPPPTTGPKTTPEHQDDPAEFDPYAVALVPTFQRTGADGLAEKLDAIVAVDDLRKMARAQQIALPAEIRRGDIPAETVRAAIVRAVEKRIADRRAAAG